MLNDKRGFILFIVLSTVLIVAMLAGVILSMISSQSRLTNHQVSRIKAYYAGKGMMNYTLEMLRGGTWTLPSSGVYYACHRGCIDSVTESYDIPDDSDIPYKVQVTIYPANSGIPNTARLEIKTEYTYTP
ncbi:MAG: hypothetical protein COT38_01730 [Candidatus Omnitrophica bacterium CG08_land_8_20_14_0_20_41_16]|uniref:Type 4 fimbrial biogenesis protein PilX N-terminal domain-containing protein n=1 Tax=Candidatus Sherwoodlollariibacterium unditelluris TaxID=1974757 RepID=A0A2G9YJE6_9BACT|nr:MAG: hypothetical protein COX41_03390 [Candidatus Omnitrophica bacterium CG23_combo_of_CG06-09_8_20_14_all_41_10]PIS34131.1 MAG: hypothetical protein COT38_01730 [Candidatus Omnitrophica bacterium CG08_land_8_20_14_0_20_41_16]